MELDVSQAIGLALTAILLCTSHMCAGLLGGYRLGLARRPRAEAPYTQNLLTLLQRSQDLHVQLVQHARDMPERVIVAATQLLMAADDLHRGVPQKWKAIPGNADPPEETADAPKRQLNRLSSDDSTSLRSRRPYPVRQLAAFFEDQPPAPDEFAEVQCIDLSAEGISFLQERMPLHKQVIITLGTSPNLTFMLAKVRNRRFVFVEGRECCRIGCQFISRLDSGEYRWNESRQAVEAGPELKRVEVAVC